MGVYVLFAASAFDTHVCKISYLCVFWLSFHAMCNTHMARYESDETTLWLYFSHLARLETRIKESNVCACL